MPGIKLTIVTFLFSPPIWWHKHGHDPFYSRHVNALWRGCADNIKIPHRFIAYTDNPDGIECERRPSLPRVRILKPDGIGVEDGCYSRLQLYDPDVQAELGTEFILIIDLDVVFFRDATPLIEKAMQADFTIAEGSRWANGALCNYYNGSFQMCRNGARPQFWRAFDPEAFYMQRERYKLPSGKRPRGTDQAWLCVCAGPGENTIGQADGFYQHRVLRGSRPRNMQICSFSGKLKPWHQLAKLQSPDIVARWGEYADQ